MTKEECLQRIIKTGIIAVIRAETPELALKISESVRQGGVEAIEITMTVPGAVEVIKELAKNYPNGEILIGAGTVLDSETARTCLLAGAEFIVSPGFNREMVRLANRYRKLVMPGAMTVTEIMAAMESGADIVKLFPGNHLGPAYVKALRGPLPHARIVPTGGVSLDNVAEWIKSGCVAVGVGGKLTAGARQGNYQLVTETAREFVARIQAARRQ